MIVYQFTVKNIEFESCQNQEKWIQTKGLRKG